MLELPHVLAGITIATVIQQPILSLPLAFASHFVLDLIPHWDPPLKEYKKNHQKYQNILYILFADSFSALVIGTYIAAQALPNATQALNILFCALFAVLPDLLGIPEILIGRPTPVIKNLLRFQDKTHHKAPIIPGLLTQVIVIIVCLVIVLSKYT